MSSQPVSGAEPVLELRFGQVGVSSLRLRQLDVAAIAVELAGKVRSNPSFLQHAPVILDLGSLAALPDVATARELLGCIHGAGLHTVGLAYGSPANEVLARSLGLPLLARFREDYQPAGAAAPSAAPAPAPPPEPVAAAPAPSPAAPAEGGFARLEEQPVRSGQQVYAQGRDLVVTALVGHGAEVIADGSIHLYGALRGRALAGALGDTGARIFCREFHAELVSIAGVYRVFEDIPAHLQGRPVHARLEGDKLLIEPL